MIKSLIYSGLSILLLLSFWGCFENEPKKNEIILKKEAKPLIYYLNNANVPAVEREYAKSASFPKDLENQLKLMQSHSFNAMIQRLNLCTDTANQNFVLTLEQLDAFFELKKAKNPSRLDSNLVHYYGLYPPTHLDSAFVNLFPKCAQKQIHSLVLQQQAFWTSNHIDSLFE